MKPTEMIKKAGGAERTACVVLVGFIVNVMMYNEVNFQTSYLQLCDVDVWIPQLFP